MKSIALLTSVLTLATFSMPLITTWDNPQELEVGHKLVRGKSLKPFEGRWSGAGETIISEVATLEKVDGKKCYVRRQVWPMQTPGLELHSETVLDAKTLATVSFQREVVGLGPGMGLGGKSEFARWEFTDEKFKLIEKRGGQEHVSQGALAAPMFEGSVLGLIIAALPLKKGYSARIPIAMTLGLGTDLTSHTIQIRVVGSEKLESPKGKKIKAWIVEADWCDYGEKEVSYPGGINKSGGTYFVYQKPPKGIPHVARYQNDGTMIDLILSPE